MDDDSTRNRRILEHRFQAVNSYAVTGSHVNGFSFFKLKRKKEVAQ